MAALSLPKSIPENDGVIARFVEYLQVEKGLSGLTVEAYRCDLTQLAHFLGSRPLLAARREDMGDYQRKLLASVQASSVARKAATFRHFFKFLLMDGLISADPMRFIESPKGWKKLPTWLTPAEIDTVLTAPQKADHCTLRNQALLELLYGAGLRVSEITTARLSDLNFSERYITVRGKGDKERIAPFGGRAAQALKDYLDERRRDAEALKAWLDKQEGFPVPPPGSIVLRCASQAAMRRRLEAALSPWLFCGNQGQHLTRMRLWQIVHGRFKQAGLGAHPHTLRHSCATALLEGGADVRVIQEILGHALVETTGIYTHVSTAQLRQAYLHHPRATSKHAQSSLQFSPVQPMAGLRLCENCLSPASAGKTRCELHLRLAAEATRLSRARKKDREQQEAQLRKPPSSGRALPQVPAADRSA